MKRLPPKLLIEWQERPMTKDEAEKLAAYLGALHEAVACARVWFSGATSFLRAIKQGQVW